MAGARLSPVEMGRSPKAGKKIWTCRHLGSLFRFVVCRRQRDLHTSHQNCERIKFLWLCQEQVGTAWGMRSGLRPCEVPPCEYSVCGMPLRAATGGWQSPNLSQQVVMLARRAMCASAGWECSPPAPRPARGTVGRFEYRTRRPAVLKVFTMEKSSFSPSFPTLIRSV